MRTANHDHEMEMIARRTSRRANVSDFFTAGNVLSLADIDAAQVQISRLKSARMIDIYRITT